MAHPAELLHAQLSEWNSPGSLSTTRGLPSIEGFRKMRVAVTNLGHVVEILDRMDASGEDSSPWRMYEEAYYRAVFGFEVPWSSGTVGSPVDVNVLASLKMLTAATRHFVARLQPGGLESLRECLDELPPLPDGVPYELAAYTERVVSHLKWCLDHFDEFGEFSLQKAASDFRIMVATVIAETPEAERGPWVKFREKRMVWPFVHDVLSTVVGAVAAAPLVEVSTRAIEAAQ